MDENGYPEEDELRKIKNWDHRDLPGLFEELKRIWCWTDCCIIKEDSLELHTGGWSGNESVVMALEKSMFWLLYWEESRRGGHYRFSGWKK